MQKFEIVGGFIGGFMIDVFVFIKGVKIFEWLSNPSMKLEKQ